FGCIVETAHEGNEALMMVRNSDPGEEYDAIIADIRLPDLSGYNILMTLTESLEEPPLVLMTGFGYDPRHSIVKARQAGLKPYAILYKPFKLEQLLETIERLIQPDKAEKV
ncbi:MAG: response regulator, partial [Planctomycetaceae bacterium]|nr:response regulator [Planctomycetaceae bacterium]